jgi:hypothetical protein
MPIDTPVDDHREHSYAAVAEWRDVSAPTRVLKVSDREQIARRRSPLTGCALEEGVMAVTPNGADRPPGPDSSWGPLYRAGAVSAGLAVILYAAALVIFAVTTAPPTSGGARMLEYVDAHRTIYIVRQLLWLVPSLLLIVVFLALAVALRHLGRSFAAIAGLIAVASWAVSFAWPTTGDGSLAMVLLSDKYAAATTAVERTPFVAGAEVLIALNDVPAVIGVLQTFGILLMSLLMLRGRFQGGLPGWVWRRARSGSSRRCSGRCSAGRTRSTACCSSSG